MNLKNRHHQIEIFEVIRGQIDLLLSFEVSFRFVDPILWILSVALLCCVFFAKLLHQKSRIRRSHCRRNLPNQLVQIAIYLLDSETYSNMK